MTYQWWIYTGSKLSGSAALPVRCRVPLRSSSLPGTWPVCSKRFNRSTSSRVVAAAIAAYTDTPTNSVKHSSQMHVWTDSAERCTSRRWPWTVNVAYLCCCMVCEAVDITSKTIHSEQTDSVVGTTFLEQPSSGGGNWTTSQQHYFPQLTNNDAYGTTTLHCMNGRAWGGGGESMSLETRSGLRVETSKIAPHRGTGQHSWKILSVTIESIHRHHSACLASSVVWLLWAQRSTADLRIYESHHHFHIKSVQAISLLTETQSFARP